MNSLGNTDASVTTTTQCNAASTANAPAALTAAAEARQWTDPQIDRMLDTHVPGGSHVRDWFLQHDTPKGLQNVRDVVRIILGKANAIATAEDAPTTAKPVIAQDIEQQHAPFGRNRDGSPIGLD